MGLRLLRTLGPALALLIGGISAASCANAARASPPAIVAIGDLHGDYDAYFSLIRAAGLVDARGRWIGGKTIFVQVGDVPDRAAGTKKIIEHLMKLEKAAKKKGGEVVALIGNHEAMNVIGDLRYTTPEEFAAFRTRKSERLRDEYFAANAERLAEFYRAKDPTLTTAAVRAKFDADVPLGYLEHRAVWSPKGKFGAWVVGHDAVRVIGDTLFVHGGISSAYVAVPLADINAQVRAALNAGSGPVLEDERGPLWFRGNASETETGAVEVAAAVAAFGVRRMVIGHTPQLAGIKALYGGRVVAIDTGASRAFGGTRSYLRIEAGGAVAVNDGVATPLPEPPR